MKIDLIQTYRSRALGMARKVGIRFDERLTRYSPETAQVGAFHLEQFMHRAQRDLVAGIVQTLNENAHLADGDVCTLKPLKDALAAVGKPWEGLEE